MRTIITTIIIVMAALVFSVRAVPVVVTGKDLPRLLGKSVSTLRVTDLKGNAIPFQVDEVTDAGEYVLPMGERSNAGDGNGIFGERDEVVFLWDDADAAPRELPKVAGEVVVLSRGGQSRAVVVRSDASVPRSDRSYISYDHTSQRISTPYYYAEFAPNRFHFVKAGIKDFGGGRYVNLTNELKIAIHLRTLFGLVPMRYTEDNIVCLVRRYKAGPVRVIRRGDFHLNLGLGVKGSRAAVNQICYPQIVEVPVRVNLPVRFRTLFGQAYIEMTPVIRGEGKPFSFTVPSEKLAFSIDGAKLDTLHAAIPDGKLFMLHSGNAGYGWLLRTNMGAEHLGGSGYVMRRLPPDRRGAAECGFRLAVRDVPKGSYGINSWVFFSGGGEGDIERLGAAIGQPVEKTVSN